MSVVARTTPYRVLVVDDSALVRRFITQALAAARDIEVVGGACDPYEAREMILRLKPDLITLDIEMPRMDGLTFLKILMEKYPMPVIVLSSLSQKNSSQAMEALNLGAADVLGKPNGANSLGDIRAILAERIRTILSDVSKTKSYGSVAVRKPRTVAEARPPVPARMPGSWNSMAVGLIGASTGGTVALKRLLTRLPAIMPGLCIVQHMPAYITKRFADGLNAECAMCVREAVEGDWVEDGLALIAPGDYHMLLTRESGRYRVRLRQTPKVWYQRPAVDVLFRSAVAVAGRHAVAVVLTGMGRDGAEGLLQLKQAGARTIAQDEATSAVYGMPKVAYELGGVDVVLPIDEIAAGMQRLFVK
jgi:two-component system chemotaxis response regulator CheB